MPLVSTVSSSCPAGTVGTASPRCSRATRSSIRRCTSTPCCWGLGGDVLAGVENGHDFGEVQGAGGSFHDFPVAPLELDALGVDQGVSGRSGRCGCQWGWGRRAWGAIGGCGHGPTIGPAVRVRAGLFTPVQEFRIDAQQDSHAVPGPLRDSGCFLSATGLTREIAAVAAKPCPLPRVASAPSAKPRGWEGGRAGPRTGSHLARGSAC